MVEFRICRVGKNISQKCLFYLHIVAVPVGVFASSTEDLHLSVLLATYDESDLYSN